MIADTPTSLADVLQLCAARGIRLIATDDDGLAIDGPRHAVTPELVSQLKSNKIGLLRVLRNDPATLEREAIVWADSTDAAVDKAPADLPDWFDSVSAPSGRQLTSSDTRRAGTHGGIGDDALDPDGWPAGSIDPDEVPPCPTCGSLEQWQSAAGDLFGVTRGRWHCCHCDPPTAALRMRQITERIQKRGRHAKRTRRNGK